MGTITNLTTTTTYSDFATAVSAASAGDILEASGTWASADTASVTVGVDNLELRAVGDSKHPGYVSNADHHRLEVSNGDNCITLNNTGCVLKGLVVKQARSNGQSDEGIRYGAAGITADVIDSIIHAGQIYNDQDGIYLTATSTINLTNSAIYGFHRGGIHNQNEDNVTINVNSSFIYNNGHDASADSATSDGSGGILVGRDPTSCVVNVFNSVVVGNTTGTNAKDFEQNYSAGTTTWNIDYCIDSDGSINTRDSGAVGSLVNHNITDDNTKSSDGDWVIVEDITTFPYDLRLQDNTYNEAQDMHASSTGAGLTIPATDIIGTSRPQNTDYDCGAFEIVAGGASTHTINGTAASQSATISGTIDNFTTHTISGTAASQSASIAGNIDRFTVHTISGTVNSQSASIAGTIDNFVTHTISGTVNSEVATISGNIDNFAVHTISGTVNSQSAGISGNIDSHTVITISGVVASEDSVITGVIDSFSTHTISGTVNSLSAGIDGNITIGGAHTISGTVESGPATVSGNINNFTVHSLSGTVNSQDAGISGNISSSGAAFKSFWASGATITQSMQGLS